MAKPHIKWNFPLVASSTSPGANPGDPDVSTYVSVSDPHILRNDLVTISRKAPSSPAIPGVTAGAYYAQFNDVKRTINPFVAGSGTKDGTEGNPADVPANTQYTYTDEGKIGLDGGVYELLPFSSCVSPAVTVTFTDFAGTGASGYPKTYNSNDGSPQQTGVSLCSGTANVEVETSYRIEPMSVGPDSTGVFGTSATPSNPVPAVGNTAGYISPAVLGGSFTSHFGDVQTSSVTLFSIVGDGTGSPGWTSASFSNISENYTVGGTLGGGTSVTDPRTGSIVFSIRPDTEAILRTGNETITQTGTASWAAGQDRIMTVTTSSSHGLTDQYNRVYISGSSNNAMNGLWNVATVTGTTSFTVKLLAAQCGPSAITSSVNVITYDGIDKKGGLLRNASGTINTIQKVVTRVSNHPDPDTHNIEYRYTGSHGLGSSGTVTASVSGSGYGGGTHGSNPIPAGDFTGSVTLNSGTQFTRSVASGLAGASGLFSGQVTDLATGLNASTFNADNDIEVVAGGMSGNNQVILKGDVGHLITGGNRYAFHGNSTSSQVCTVEFTGATKPRTLFHDAGFKLNTNSGRVFTEGAPESINSINSSMTLTSHSGTDGTPFGFDPNTNPDGGVKEIDKWCPRYMHAKAQALVRNDITELLKANTSGQIDLDQTLASPMVDDSDELTTFLHPRFRLHETCWFTMRAEKNPAHRLRPSQTENEDFIDRQFGIVVYSNVTSDRNEIVLDYIDQTNTIEISNTDTAFSVDGERVTNQEFLNNGYANGNFKNQ